MKLNSQTSRTMATSRLLTARRAATSSPKRRRGRTHLPKSQRREASQTRRRERSLRARAGREIL